MNITRRTLLKTALSAAPLAVAPHVLGRDGTESPNETVRLGVIGLGGRANYLFDHTFPQMNSGRVVSVCDIFEERLTKFQQKHQGKFNAYADFRAMIEKEKLDGVFIETATHQRVWIAIHAMLCGANIYIEKPMALTIREGRALVNAARKLKKTTQVGSQQRSLPLCRWACRQIAEGAIGKVLAVQVPNFVGPSPFPNDPQYAMDPKDCPDWWNVWTNQAQLRTIAPAVQFGWSRWADYDAGGLCFGVSGWGTHSFDQMQMAIGTSLTGPVKILLEEPCAIQDSGKYPNRVYGEDETGAAYYGMARVTGPRARMTATYANGVEVRFELNGDRGPGLGCIVIGEKGKIEINRHKISSNPKSLAASIPNECRNSRDESVYHVENWVECIKSGEKCAADVEIGQRSNTICNLVNIVRDTAPVGKEIHWNPEKEEFTDLPEANALLERPRREGWELPTV